MTLTRLLRVTALLTLGASALIAHSVSAQTQKARLVLPATSVLFAPLYIAQDADMFKQAGVEVDMSLLPGPSALNAVIGGSAEFAVMPGFLVIRAAQRGQKTLAIAGLQETATTEIVLSPAVADKLSAEKTPIDRVRALKGLTLAVDAANGLPHAWLRYISRKAGIDADKDIRLSFIAPPNMDAALKKGDIDGFVFSSPFTLESVQRGARLWVSAPSGDFPELNPTTYSILVAKEGYCEKHPATCKAMVLALDRSMKLIKTDPQKSLALLSKRFERMDQELLKQAFEVFRRNTPDSPRPLNKAFAHTVDTMFDTVEDKSSLRSMTKSLYSDEYVNSLR